MSEFCGNSAAETGEALMPKKRKFDRSRVCVKCKTNSGNLVIRHSVYCKDCFTPLISTKFRQALEPLINHVPAGPRRGALKPSGGLLIGFSGGLGSSVLLDLVHKVYCTSVGDDELKGGREHPRRNRVWKKIHVCYVETSDAFPEARQPPLLIREAVARYDGYEFIPVRIQDAFDRGWWERVSGGSPSLSELPFGPSLGSSADSLFSKSLSCPLGSGPVSALQSHLRALPTPTATLSTLSTLTRLLLLYTAYSIGASHLVLGTSLTSLSISLISSISQGGGFVVPQAIQEEWAPPFVERTPGDNSWNGEVRLVRPLRDVGMKECTAWVWWHQLLVVGKQRIPIPKQTIDGLTKDFIIGLERDYPSTVSTIAKTVGKLAPKGKPGVRCVLCELPTQQSVQAWKARTAIHSFTDGAPPADVAPRYLCYSCHATLTSKSSRSTATLTLDSSTTTSAQNLPIWAAARLAFGMGDEQSADSPATPADEIWETKKLDPDDMKSLVGKFFLDK
ncbi:hypothetical protein BJV78DRAFT_1322562 [Lactifluus subvellereus]|nr:hypothetical protein BJV78DRAFT_1322562 [Lactifluus subvellereus]